MLNDINALYQQMLQKFEGGLSNTSTKKFDDIVSSIANVLGIPVEEVYATGSGSRPGNLEVRLSQGVRATIHTTVGLGFIVDEKNDPNNVEKLTNSALVTCKKFLGRGKAHYDNIVIFVESNGSISASGLICQQRTAITEKLITELQIDNVQEVAPSTESEEDSESNSELQIIYYGAPGTGKSHKISDDKNLKIAATRNLVFRTTFHPDTDYATFVGCYKPKTHKKSMINGNGINETQLLSCFFDSNNPKYKRQNKARYLYEALVHTKDIRDLGLDAQAVADKLNANGFSGCAYTTEATCMYNIYDWLREDGYIVDSKLSYEFAPQCFVKAYVEAWKHQQSGEPVFLIIEEINRGNCAQIFGDLFQLLDRDNNGFSRYEISPDSDLQEYISELGLDIKNITDADGNDISAKIANGELMKLPNNLYIWATMNTSDQSLFPIDSAFKRRWDWEYIPIGYKNNNWIIEIGDKKYKWVDFQRNINGKIFEVDNSEDKQLGDFFVNADKTGGKISAQTLLNKILFYIWNDVCKDDPESIFRWIDGKQEKSIKFSDFFGADRDKKLQGFMAFNKINAIGESENTADSENVPETGGTETDETAEESESEVKQ